MFAEKSPNMQKGSLQERMELTAIQDRKKGGFKEFDSSDLFANIIYCSDKEGSLHFIVSL